MTRHDEAHSACLSILNDSPHSAVRIADLCTFVRALGGEIDELRAQLDACAAGPWRYDVENAPRDGSEVWCEFHRFGRVVRTAATWQSLGGYWGTFTDATFEAQHLHAFAVPNPPQVTT